MDNRWYSVRTGPQWYDPLAVPPQSAGMVKKKKRTWLIALIAAVLLIGLIVGSALIFGAKRSAEEQNAPPEGLPKMDDFAEDFKDFFDSYYTSREEAAECTIPRVERYSSFTVQLHPASEEKLTLQEIYEKCAPSVVAITAYTDNLLLNSYYWGTGIVLTSDGYIVTNSHLVEGTCRATVTLWNDEEYEVRLVGYDPRSDVAVLKIDAPGLIPAEFCDTETLSVGDQVVAIGNPLGVEFRSTMTEGIISGIDRDISYNGTSLTLIQTSAPINEGNSGGPLINMYGQVIGITNMKMSSQTGRATVEGVGFAIPSRTVKAMADSILSTGEVLGRPALGLTLGSIPEAAKERYGIPEGLYVSEVADGSDCKAQGIRRGDILLAVDGESVNTTGQVTAILKDKVVGDTMVLTVWREGQGGKEPTTFDVTVRLVDVNDVY